MAVFPIGTAANADLYVGVNNLSTVLTDNPLTAGATTVNVSSTANFPNVGIITIELEAIHYTAVTATSFTGCTRGFDGTTGASHPTTTTVFHDIPAAHHNVLKDEIIAIETYLKDVLDETANGSVTSPAYSFANDPDSGMYSTGPNGLGFAVNGTSAVQLNSSFQWLLSSGTLSNPGLAFEVDIDTGIYRDSPGSFSAVINAVMAMNFNATSIIARKQLQLINGTVGAPSVAFENDPDSGIYSQGASDVSITTSGVLRANFLDTVFATTVPIQVPNGTEALPSYSFSTDPDSGLMRIGADRIGLGVNGSVRFQLRDTFSEHSDVVHFPAGSSALPSITFGDIDTGIYGSGISNIDFSIAGAQTYKMNTNYMGPTGDNTHSSGQASTRWSDVRSVLINGADYGFMNGYILREYPASADDVQTKDEAWMRANANQGIQVINDEGTMVAVIARDGTIYANAFKSLAELPN